ncbi:HTH-type transcriptional regulator MtrR [Mycolicibacterium vanbaalenii]|uniref:HTH-type transcriptional regulator MtrR n=1 Tax=Mycolicibacterium vanbaalenii TaxID=110539 RepID=A0A5S9PPC6_MYCVN|nr:TetR/AcrR family transcriptional regulator [Mycolicibacterium vanbaalenii]CAA0105843.1 HTH-type transcriptional regulator MtrR [Mycolicibacterium vanbaalenii]
MGRALNCHGSIVSPDIRDQHERRTSLSAQRKKADDGRRAAHRPSRRRDIIEAAVAVFAEKGFAEASINDIAQRAKVVQSGIYYHFETKADLFDAAIEAVYDSLDAAVEAARAGHAPGSPEELRAVIHAGNSWADEHPRASKMLYSQLPGATPRSAQFREEHEARHAAAAFRYLERDDVSADDSGVNSINDVLTARTLVHLMISVMPLRLDGGALSRRSAQALEVSLQAVGHRIVFD